MSPLPCRPVEETDTRLVTPGDCAGNAPVAEVATPEDAGNGHTPATNRRLNTGRSPRLSPTARKLRFALGLSGLLLVAPRPPSVERAPIRTRLRRHMRRAREPSVRLELATHSELFAFRRRCGRCALTLPFRCCHAAPVTTSTPGGAGAGPSSPTSPYQLGHPGAPATARRPCSSRVLVSLLFGAHTVWHNHSGTG